MPYPSVEIQNRLSTLHISEEASLYPLWVKQRGNTFQTTQGPVTIVDPGVLNPYSGPDFLNAVIEFRSGGMRRGDVEIHNDSHGWALHRHQNDPAFANVILQVIRFGIPEDIALTDIRPIPTLVLNGLPGRAGESCQSIAIDLGAEFFLEVIRCFSRLRWEAMVLRFSPPDAQTVVMQTLKLIDPKSNFRSVSKLQSFVLRQLTSESISLPALLEESVLYSDRLTWVMGRKRPRSHPRYRVPLLVLLAVLLATDPHKVCKITLGILQDYCRILVSRGYFVPGASTLEEILGNIVLPFSAAHSGMDLFDRWMALPTQTYGLTQRRLKTWNLHTRITFGYQQGVLQLEKEFCQPGLCGNCPLINHEEFIA